MQTILLTMEPTTDLLWTKAALRECIQYGEHGVDTETDEQGREHCFNCGAII